MPGRRRGALVVVVGALLLAACEYPFPDAGPDGTGPSLVWISSPDPPTQTVVDPGFAGQWVGIGNPTSPAVATCGVGYPAALCVSHYQGTGFAVVLPALCSDRQVGITRLVVNDAVVATPARAGTSVNAALVTVSGTGRIDGGFWGYDQLGTPHDARWSVDTARVPEADAYEVKLTCVIGEDGDGSPIQMTFVGVVAPPAVT